MQWATAPQQLPEVANGPLPASASDARTPADTAAMSEDTARYVWLRKTLSSSGCTPRPLKLFTRRWAKTGVFSPP